METMMQHTSTGRDIEVAEDASTDYMTTKKPIASHRRRRRSCCCYAIIFSLSMVMGVALLLGVAAGGAWLALQPKAPEFGISGVRLIPAGSGGGGGGNGQVAMGNTLPGALEVSMKVGNPNKKIGIHYDDLQVELAMADGEGSNPAIASGRVDQGFYQGPRSEPPATVTVDLPLSGGAAVNGKMLTTLMASGSSFPARIKVNAAVRISVGSWTSGTSHFSIDCLASVNPIALLASSSSSTSSSSSSNSSPNSSSSPPPSSTSTPPFTLTSCKYKLKSFKL